MIDEVNSDALAYVKTYLRIEEECVEWDTELSLLILQAEEFIYNATKYKITYRPDRKIEFLSVMLLVTHFYQNRNPVTSQSVNLLPFSIQSVLRQLEFSYHDEVVDPL